MTTFSFHPRQSFEEVRRRIGELNGAGNKSLVAHLTWRDGTAKDQTVVYLYDPLAERFGHIVDKESIGVEIVSSLMNGIPLDVKLAPRKGEE
jgi:hypothetical protein